MGPFRIRRWEHSLRLASIALLMSVMLAPLPALAKEPDMKYPTAYRNHSGRQALYFFREAGPKDAATILLLQGLPSSSRMFEPLVARLSDLVLLKLEHFNSRDVKGTIPISQGAISAKVCLPTPFDFNNLPFVAALSRHGQMQRQGTGGHEREPGDIRRQ